MNTTNNRDLPVVNGKTISYDLMLNVIGRKFHTCLLDESKAKPDLANTLSDAELVHQVCRHERLTFYNFLKEHTVNGLAVSEESVKEQLNREYGFYFKKKDQTGGRKLDIYGDDSSWNPLPLGSALRGNTVRQKFDVNFE